MSIGLQILEGLANLDEGYANRRAQEKRDDKQNKWQTERDIRLNDMTLQRDKLLAAEQAVRDARLHGNAMDLQKAQIDADRVRYEYQNAQENLRQHEALGHQSKESKKERKWKSGERKDTQKFQSLESGKERDWRTGERVGAQEWQTGEREGAQDWHTNERLGTQGFQSIEADRNVDRDERRMGAGVKYDLEKARGLHKAETDAERDAIVQSAPDELPIEDRYKLARRSRFIKSVAPMLTTQDRLTHPERYTQEGWRFDPRANKDYRDGMPSSPLAPKGTGMTIKDLLEKQQAPQPAEPAPGSDEWLRRQLKFNSIQ